MEYQGWLTKIEKSDKKQVFQVRIDCNSGYYIIEIDPETKKSYLTKDRLKDGV